MLRMVVGCLIVIHELENVRKEGSGWGLRAVVGDHEQSLKSSGESMMHMGMAIRSWSI